MIELPQISISIEFELVDPPEILDDPRERELTPHIPTS
jgi:hypothetical protein